jgi:hypothetical protein
LRSAPLASAVGCTHEKTGFPAPPSVLKLNLKIYVDLAGNDQLTGVLSDSTK